MSTTAPTSRLAKIPKVGRASRSLARLWQAPTFLAGLLLLLVVAVSAPLRRDPAIVQFEEDILKLRRGLQSPEHPDVLIAQSENLLARLPKFTRRSAEVHFLVGSAYFRAAERTPQAAGLEARTKAIAHLEEAYSRGVDAGDQAQLLYRLGWAIYHQNPREQDLTRAIEYMTLGVEKGADAPGLAYGFLVQAHLRRLAPDLDGALAASQKQLELTDDRNVPAMAQARLVHAELLIKKGLRMDAIKELERMTSAAPVETRAPARALQARACEEEGLWDKAVSLWTEILPEESHVPGGKALILYHLGLCHQNADRASLEEAARCWEAALALGGEEGRAAGLRLGEMRLSGTLPDAARGLEDWNAALAGLRSLTDYDGSLVPLSQARRWFEDGFKTFVDVQDFRRGEQLALLYKKLAEPGRAEQLLAEALFSLAQEAKDRMKTMPVPAPKKKLEEVRSQYHRAAVAFEQAAALHKEPANVLWQAAHCYREAHDHAQAVKALERYVHMERGEGRLAEAYLHLAEAQVALGEKEKARQAYYKCIEFPSTPFAYRARYHLAVDEIEKKNYEQARNILKQNLEETSPMMDREAHENSLYKMAGLLILLKDYSQAILRLKDANRLYPSNPLALAARDQLADCYRKLAEEEKAREDAAKADETRLVYRRKRMEFLDLAFRAHQGLADELENKARERELGLAEQATLRRALFGAADARFDMNEFTEALTLYQGIQARHRKKIESLLACQRIYKCVGVMIEPAQIKLVHSAALQAVALAQQDIVALPADADVFRGPGVWTKEEWTLRLQEIGDRLTPAGVIPKGAGPVIK